jgi:hypothetical protein
VAPPLIEILMSPSILPPSSFHLFRSLASVGPYEQYVYRFDSTGMPGVMPVR